MPCFSVKGGLGPLSPPPPPPAEGFVPPTNVGEAGVDGNLMSPPLNVNNGEGGENSMEFMMNNSMDYYTSDCCCLALDETAPPPGIVPVDPVITDDTTFLRNIAAKIVVDVPKQTNNRVTINTKRIYMAGHSNGCTAGLAMAATNPDMVAAVCCHSPALIAPYDDINHEYANNPVPTWIVHGKQDGTVPYDGWYPRGPQVPLYNPGAKQVNDILAEVNHCDLDDFEMTINPAIAGRRDMQIVTTTTRTNCRNDATVELVSLELSGHTPYMNAPLFDGGMTKDMDNAQITTIDTTQLAWDFCSSFERDVEPNLALVLPMSESDGTSETDKDTEEDPEEKSSTFSVNRLSFWMLSAGGVGLVCLF